MRARLLWRMLYEFSLAFAFGFSLSPPQMKGASSSALPVMPAAKPLICRVPSSVEGINHELENVFIREGWEHGIQVGAQQRARSDREKSHTDCQDQVPLPGCFCSEWNGKK